MEAAGAYPRAREHIFPYREDTIQWDTMDDTFAPLHFHVGSGLGCYCFCSSYVFDVAKQLFEHQVPDQQVNTLGHCDSLDSNFSSTV